MICRFVFKFIQFDLSPIQNFFKLPIDQSLYIILVDFGWIPIAVTLLYGAALLWVFYRNSIYDETLGEIVLAVDIPRANEQSVKAVENIFTYLGGAHSTFNLIDMYWRGMFQLSFSFEIVSIEGYTQFLIWTRPNFRNLVETAIYSQYPDAEITEVNDYTEGMPKMFPDDEWDVWGGEFILAKPDAYPIKTYPEFGDDMGKPETAFKDPMATLMDLCSSLGPGEQLWYQLLVYPTGFDWPARMQKEVKKILKEKNGSGGTGITDMLIDGFFGAVNVVLDALWGGEYRTTKEMEQEPLKMLQLKPQEKKQVEAIQHKASKLGFECKNRFVYIAKKEVFNKSKAVSGFVGYMKQFMDLDLNNLKPDMDKTVTTANYFFEESTKNQKKSKIVNAYMGRSGTRGRKRYILNIEELATIWHFPIEAVVKAPLIQKAPGRKAEPPMSLPLREETAGAPGFLPEGDIEANGMAIPFAEPTGGKPAARPETAEKAVYQDEKRTFSAEALPWGEIIPPGKPASPKQKKANPKGTEKKGSAPENLPFA